LADEAIVITGAAVGIGRAVALTCAERGASVAVLDRDGDGAAAVAAEAREKGAKSAVDLACDVSSEEDVKAAFTTAVSALGPLRGLVCNAGIDRGGMAHELATDTWRQVIATNLEGVYLCCKHGLRAFLEEGQGGSIVCVSSPLAFRGFSGGTTAYSASKGGVSALVRSLAIDYAPYGVRVNAVVPGATETTLMWANVPESDVDRMREVVRSEVPLGRLAVPEEPARAAVWLLSRDASYVTGSHLVCDGGVLAKGALSA
jgi:NAD(P)-dependent dehydrogenase (short-subunit alcohol dehydrogenase family)